MSIQIRKTIASFQNLILKAFKATNYFATNFFHWGLAFHRDGKALVRAPKVFMGHGMAVPYGQPLHLKERRHVPQENAETIWRNLKSKGLKRTEPLWGTSADSRHKKTGRLNALTSHNSVRVWMPSVNYGVASITCWQGFKMVIEVHHLVTPKEYLLNLDTHFLGIILKLNVNLPSSWFGSSNPCIT